jgi:hypothetical protein
MSVNKFGRSSHHVRNKHGFSEITDKDNIIVFDAKRRRIINIENPIEDFDVTSKLYVDAQIKNNVEALNSILKDEEDFVDIVKTEKSKLVTVAVDYIKEKNSKIPLLDKQVGKEVDVLTLRDLLNIFTRWRNKE